MNALPNVLWTGIFLGPVYIFCARHVSLPHLYTCAALSAVAQALPASVLRRLQLSAHPAAYRRIGVPFFVKITQDAPWLRRFGGDADTLVRRDPKAIARRLRDTWMRERFHFGLLVFCALCFGLALWQRQFKWSLCLLVANTLYNLYPVWLQQYLRLRMTRLLRARPEGRCLDETSPA